MSSWRDYLTGYERGIVDKADEAKARWVELKRDRQKIANRAMKRVARAGVKADDLRRYSLIEPGIKGVTLSDETMAAVDMKDD